MERARVRWVRGFAAGAAGGAAVAVVLFAYRFATGMPTFQEALAERMIRLLPYQVFALILAQLQHAAKPLGLAMAVLASIFGLGLGGVVYAGTAGRSRRSPVVLAAATAAITWLALTFVFLPAIEGNLLGVPLTTIVTAPALPMGIASAVYAAVLALVVGRPAARRAAAPGDPRSGSADRAPGTPAAHPAGRDAADGGGLAMRRRDLLRRSPVIVAAVLAGTVAASWIATAGAAVARAAEQTFRLLKGMPDEVTPAGQFYQVSKNFFDPTVDVKKWTLEVTGMVNKPLRLSLEEFQRAAAPVERYHTFECISNEVGGDLIGNAKWKGIRMKDVLDLAGLKPGVTTIIMRSVDGYAESVPLDVAVEPTTLLAFEMNGAPIPQKHGAPVRVLIMNRYGMKQPKWLTSIEAANHDFTGYWEQQGWSKQAIVKTNSAFKVETKDGARLALGGWAFAGSRGIAKVEVSADGGKTWMEAAVKPALGQNTWQFWSLEWQPPRKGEYALRVRATDGTGALQPEAPEPTLPDGAQGYHTVHVTFN